MHETLQYNCYKIVVCHFFLQVLEDLVLLDSVYWFVKWWLILETAHQLELLNILEVAERKNVKNTTVQMSFCLRWMTLKSEP